MHKAKLAFWLAYGEALCAVGLATLVRWWAEPALQGHVPFILLFAAVAYCIWRIGLGPAIFGALVGYGLHDMAIRFEVGSVLSGGQGSLLAFGFYLIACAMIIGIGHALRRANERLKKEVRAHEEAEARFRTLVESVPSAVILSNKDGRIVLSNGYASLLLGYDAPELLAMNVEQLMPERFRGHHPGLRDGYHASPSARPMGKGRDLFALAKDHREIPVEVGLNPVASNGDTLVLAAIADITDRKRAFQEVQDSDRRKTEFLATLSHELRNPLAPIRSGLDAILRHEDADPEVRKKLLTMMDRQASQMSRLVEDLLDLSRISQGTLILHRRACDLRECVETALDMVRDRIQSAGQRLESSLPQEPVWVEGDPVRLTQAAANLLVNAYKFTPDGGTISVRLVPQDGQARLEVSDTGVGLSPEGLEALFGLFKQSGEALKNRPVGLGVGLALTKQIVEMHEGMIEAQSGGPGKGTRFTLSLPLGAPPIAGPAPSETIVAQIEELAPRKVMVVDDNRDAADSLALLLGMDGHEVKVCYSGQEALDSCGDFKPDAVFLDLGMPGMDGFATAKALQEREVSNGAFLVALSGWGQEADQERSREAGFQAHLTKPADYREIQALLSRLRQEA